MTDRTRILCVCVCVYVCMYVILILSLHWLNGGKATCVLAGDTSSARQSTRARDL